MTWSVSKSFVVFLLCFDSTIDVCCECVISLKDDFGNPQAVFVKNSSLVSTWIDRGAIYIGQGEAVTAACPGPKQSLVLKNETSGLSANIDFLCGNNKTFNSGQWTGEFKDIRCNTKPWFSVEETGVTCSSGNHMLRVGYKLLDDFFTLYEVCFDNTSLTTKYVKHTLSPMSFRQPGGRRPSFIAGNFYGKFRISTVFKKETQIEIINTLLGDNSSDTFITKKQFLNRGHLVPGADFPLRTEQRTTYHYINVAPQWKLFNAGDWAALEQALRDRIKKASRPVIVYTGTHGITTLPDKDGNGKEIHLHSDENNNPIIPVPLYFFKVVYEPELKKATAFVSINNPYYKEEQIEELVFCEDVCRDNPQFSWLKWRARDKTTSFCCSYRDFVNNIDILPPLDVVSLFH